MNQQMRQPVRQEWRGFLDTVTEETEGEPVTIEVVTAELGSRVEADRLPLAFINYDEKDEAVIVSLRGREGEEETVLEHMVKNPWKILFDPPSPDTVRTI